MRDTYARASSVLVIDGDIRRLRKRDPPLEYLTRFVLSGWEQRLWTLHESHMARQIHFLAKDGAITLKLSTFAEGRRSDPLQSTVETLVFGGSVTRFFLPKQKTLSSILSVLSSRATSRPEDETIVLANMLDINNAPLQALEDAGDGMVYLLRQLPEIPLAIMFARGG